MSFEIAKTISPLIKNQLPELYLADESMLADFMTAYYQWMESTGNPLYYSRRILDNVDIDSSLDEFVCHFKEQYMNKLPDSSKVDTRTLLKHITDLYKSKGSYQSFKLLFRIMFGADAELYYPGDDVIKPSDGTWKEPIYLELSSEVKGTSFEGQEIIGDFSGATAFVDSRVRRLISGGVVDVVFLSGVKGNFEAGEKVTTLADNSFLNAPVVKGSLTSISILNGGKNNIKGDIFDVKSSFGVEGKARVATVGEGTGRVNFTLVDGGSGYTTDANTKVLISESVFTLTDTENRLKYKNLLSMEGTSATWGFLDDQTTNWLSTKTVADSWSVVTSPWNNRSEEFWEVKGHATASGGFKTADVSITAGQTIRIFIPFKIDGSNDGVINFKVSPGQSKVVNLDGTAADDILGTFTLSGLQLNTWYVAVGYIYSFDHIGLTKAGGLYELVTGNKIVDLFGVVATNSFKWINSSISTANIEIKQTSNTNTASVRLFAKPVIQVLDSSIPDTEFAINGYSVSDGYVSLSNFETVSQNIINLTVAGATPFIPGEFVYGDSGGLPLASGFIVSDDGAGAVVVDSSAGVWFNPAPANILKADGSNSRGITNAADETVSGIVTGSDSSGFGLHSITSGKTFGVGRMISNKSLFSGIYETTSTGTGATFDIAGIQGGETISLYTDLIGGANYKGINYLDLFIDGGGSQVGFVRDFTITSAGTGYVGDGTTTGNSDQIIFKGGGLGTGASPTGSGNTFAIGLLITSGGVVTGIEMTVPGKGYTSIPTSLSITTTSGTGLAGTAILDFGYGLPKAPHADLTNLMDVALTSGNFTIGEIISLGSINPGSNYNANPFVIIINPLISGFNRRDLKLKISGASGTFLSGEEVTQTISSNDKDLTAASVSGFSVGDHVIQKKKLTRITFTIASNSNNFRVGLIAKQSVSGATGLIKSIDFVTGFMDVDVSSGVFDAVNSVGWVFSAGTTNSISAISGVSQIDTNTASGVIRSINGSIISVIPLNQSGILFTNSSTAPLSNILYLATDETGTFTTITSPVADSGTITQTFSKGRVVSVINDIMILKRNTFSEDFDTSAGAALLTGTTSLVTATAVSVEQDGNSKPMGLNAISTSDVSIASGIALTLDIIDSGFGYIDGEVISLQNPVNPFILSGTASSKNQGIGAGFWESDAGFLNSNKFIHDNDYYQAYSYEIQVGVGLNKYKNMVSDILHITGTKMFAKVIKESEQTLAMGITDNSLIQSVG